MSAAHSNCSVHLTCLRNHRRSRRTTWRRCTCRWRIWTGQSDTQARLNTPDIITIVSAIIIIIITIIVYLKTNSLTNAEIQAGELQCSNSAVSNFPIFSTSARCDVLLSTIGRLLLPVLDFGTVYLLTSSLPRYSQHFVKSWKLTSFGNLTQTLFYNCVAIVVLEVTFT